MLFLSTLLNYVIKFILYGAVALLGIFIGIRLRKGKNRKQEAIAEAEADAGEAD